MGGILGSVNDLLFGAQPTPPDFGALADKQTQANRPNQSTPFGFSNWTQDANGNWSQSTGFNGPLGGAADSLMTQWGRNAANGYGNGEDARRQAIDASWGQFQRMNDPLFAQQSNKAKSDLLNMGSDIGSEIYSTGMGDLSDAQNKMRLNAQDQAVAAGDRAQGQTFNQNRQSWLDPLNALGAMQGLLQMPGVPQAGNYLQAGQDQFNAAQQQYGQNMENITGLINGASSVAGALGGMPAPFSFGGSGGAAPSGFAYGGRPYSPGELQPPKFG